MNTVYVLFAIFAAANAGALPGTFYTRVPSADSAIIKSDRLGGNFAYSTVESHAYAAHTPIVQHVTSPVAVSYNAPVATYASPAVAAYASPAVASYAAPISSYAAPIPHAYNAYPYSAYPYGAYSVYGK